MEIIIKNRRKPRAKRVVKKFAFLPIIHQGTLFWLSKIRIEKSFNGISMQVTNIQRL